MPNNHTHRPHGSDISWSERTEAVRSLARQHRNACVRFAQYRASHSFDLRCAKLLDEVKLTRSMLVAIVEDGFKSAARSHRARVALARNGIGSSVNRPGSSVNRTMTSGGQAC